MSGDGSLPRVVRGTRKPAPDATGREVRCVFKELTEELLDLHVVEKGFRNALYAKTVADGGASCRACSACCCTFCISC
jgi:hypothetical protein